MQRRSFSNYRADRPQGDWTPVPNKPAKYRKVQMKEFKFGKYPNTLLEMMFKGW